MPACRLYDCFTLPVTITSFVRALQAETLPAPGAAASTSSAAAAVQAASEEEGVGAGAAVKSGLSGQSDDSALEARARLLSLDPSPAAAVGAGSSTGSAQVWRGVLPANIMGDTVVT